MRVIEPYQLNRKRRKTHLRRLFQSLCFLFVFLVVGYSVYAYTRPIPTLSALASDKPLLKPQPVPIRWPKYGQAAIGAIGYGVLASNRDDRPRPTASVAKVITALSVLKRRPLKAGEQGPVITLTAKDVDLYNEYVAKNGSTVLVKAGERLTEYQALEALLIPSANNMADSLVRWEFGSMRAYTRFANQLVAELGLKNTHVADASGFSPKTTSTASDLVLLGQHAMNNATIAEIVAKSEAKLPVAGTIHSTNKLLGSSGIVGIKTGNTDEAGGCYLVASSYTISNTKFIIVTAIMGAPNLATAMKDMPLLISSTVNGFQEVTVLNVGQVMGEYQVPWGEKKKVVAKQDLKGVIWKALPPSPTISLKTVALPARSNSEVGRVKFVVGSRTINTALILKDSIEMPSIFWRATRRVW